MNIVDPKDKTEPRSEASGFDDAWLASSCSLCYGSCSILAHRVDGVVVKIEGNPESAVGMGRLCGKGVAGLLTHYDPNRLTKPLRRTNPEKGIGVDPGWEEISWDDALDEIARRLKEIHEDDPRNLYTMRTTTVQSMHVPWASFIASFGTINSAVAGGGLHCGNGAHLVSGIMHASWSIVPDFEHCNHAVYFGASKGHSAGHAANSMMKKAADARARGMKMVVVDPIANFAGAKATQWVPIRVGTDAALALAMCNLLVNEQDQYDAPYLKANTNATYLIGADGKYVRDPDGSKPMVWDEPAGKAVPFDAALSEDMALEGEFQVAGNPCRPSFALLKEHLAAFTPERAEEISTVPAATVRQMAEDFGREARIGSTTLVDGLEIPYRPVAAIAFRGSQGHRNSTYNMFAVDLLNHLVGAADMVGGCLGFNPCCHGYPETGRARYVPHADKDGLMLVGTWLTPHDPFPIGDPVKPERAGLEDLYPMGMSSVLQGSWDQTELWEKFEIPFKPRMMLNLGTNMVMSIGNKDAVAASLKRFEFMVSIDIFLTETSEFADIVLPDCGYLQTMDSRSNLPFIFSHPAGMGEWSWPVRQPVLEPEGEQRPLADVLIELADRIGTLPDYNFAVNAILDLQPPNRLERDRRYTYEEICDHDLKDKFGPDKGYDWFKEHGLVNWPKKPEEVYWRHFENVRVPVYWEWMPDIWEKANAIAEPRGHVIPREDYAPLPDWLPCHSHECDEEGFDFYGFYYRDTVHTNSLTLENAWLDEAAQMDPFSYNIVINEDVGKAKGLATGDEVWVENTDGIRVQGRLRLTQLIHPEGMAFGACAGHWTDGMPVAKGKGVFFNDLLGTDLAHSSPSNLNLDLCVKLKITKIAGASA